MVLSIAGREIELLRKRVANMISQFKKSEVIHHFVQQDIGRTAVYNIINRL